jgi:large subunit ribosomal protein L15
MKFRKRKKNTRYRGSQTHRRGHRKRTKGLGNQGGKGMSGSENQKKSLIMNLYGPSYFGGDKTLRRGRVPQRLKVINLNDLIERFDNLVHQGIAKQTAKGFEFNLKGFKLLGDGPIGAKISVKASAASKSAIEQIKAAGGTIELESEEKAKKEEPEKKPEAKPEEKPAAKKPAKK